MVVATVDRMADLIALCCRPDAISDLDGFLLFIFVFAFATMSASASSSAYPWEVEGVGPPLHPWELSDFEDSDVDSGDDEPTRPENCRDTATTCFWRSFLRCISMGRFLLRRFVHYVTWPIWVVWTIVLASLV